MAETCSGTCAAIYLLFLAHHFVQNIYLLSVKFYPKLNGVKFQAAIEASPRFPLVQSIPKGTPLMHPCAYVEGRQFPGRMHGIFEAGFLAALSTALFMTAPAFAEGTPSPKNAEVFIIWPTNGTVITGGKFWLRMGLRNMGIAPKGVKLPNVGHHHVLIDTDMPPAGEQIPSDRNHLHFGAGETEARIELPPGKHTLQLLLGDHDHVPHVPPVYSKKITITVR
jgi:hypothetical protein